MMLETPLRKESYPALTIGKNLEMFVTIYVSWLDDPTRNP